MLYVVRNHLRTPGAEAQFIGSVKATGSTVKNELEDAVYGNDPKASQPPTPHLVTPFLRIPVKIRGLIYEEALPKSVYYQQDGDFRAPIKGPRILLFYICRQVNEEVKRVWEAKWTSSSHSFPQMSLLMRFLDSAPPILLSKITSLHLQFSNTNFLFFFGGTVHQFEPYGTKPNASGLRELNLRSLFLDFSIAPKGEQHVMEEFQDACQKTVVELILSFAIPFVKSIPVVELKGDVKLSTELWFAETLVKSNRVQGKPRFWHNVNCPPILERPDVDWKKVIL